MLGPRRFGRLLALLAFVSILALVAAMPAPAAPVVTATATNPVTDWNLTAVNTLTTLPGPAGGAPPASQISMGMGQGAVYDAVNAITPKHHRPYLLKRRFAATASKDAAVATAAYMVLSNIVSTVPASISFPTRASVLQSLASQYAASLSAIHDSPFKTQGVAAGNAAGAGDTRGPRGQRPVRAVSVGAELRARTLAAAGQSGHRAANSRPDPVGRRGEALPHAELLAVPHRGAARSRQRRLRGRVQRGQGARLDQQRGSNGDPDLHRSLVAEHTRRELERRRPRPHRPRRVRHRRQGPAPRDGDPECCGCGDQLLERQVLLGLLAAVECDRTGGGGRQPGD